MSTLALGLTHALKHSHLLPSASQAAAALPRARRLSCLLLLPPPKHPHHHQSIQSASHERAMSFTSIIRSIFFNLGALAVAYVLLLSGVHKFTYKLWGVELSQGLYKSLNKSYLLATEQAYKHIDAFLASHPSLPPALPRFHAFTIKAGVGAFELFLASLWLTRRWRSAAWGSVLCFASWIAIAYSEFLPDSAGGEEGMSFPLFFVGLSLALLYVGPRGGKKGGVDAAAVGAGAKKRR